MNDSNDANGKRVSPKIDALLYPWVLPATSVRTQHVIWPMVAVGVAEQAENPARRLP